METGAIGNLLKNSMQSLFAGVAGAVVKFSDNLGTLELLKTIEKMCY